MKFVFQFNAFKTYLGTLSVNPVGLGIILLTYNLNSLYRLLTAAPLEAFRDT